MENRPGGIRVSSPTTSRHEAGSGQRVYPANGLRKRGKMRKLTKAEAARILNSANDYLVRSRSTDMSCVAYSGTQAFTDLADACDILRAARLAL